jgi:chloramphenicol-sensitive protein RarD
VTLHRATHSEVRTGLLYGFATYAAWGLVFPLHLRALDAAVGADVVGRQPHWAVEILCQRVVWSLLLCVMLLGSRARRAELRGVVRSRVHLLPLAVAAILISCNWLVFVYASSTGQLYRAGIGYLVTPIVQIGLGVVFLGERLRRPQWWALALASLGMAELVFFAEGWPWIELSLAALFGAYGLVRKRVAVSPLTGLTVETLFLLGPALLGLAWVHASMGPGLAIVEAEPVTRVLMVGLGLTTAVPLMWFAAAAARLPLSTIGFLQFSAPICQFLLGVLAFGQRPSDPAMWWGYLGIGLGVAVLVGELVRFRMRNRRR